MTDSGDNCSHSQYRPAARTTSLVAERCSSGAGRGY